MTEPVEVGAKEGKGDPGQQVEWGCTFATSFCHAEDGRLQRVPLQDYDASFEDASNYHRRSLHKPIPSGISATPAPIMWPTQATSIWNTSDAIPGLASVYFRRGEEIDDTMCMDAGHDGSMPSREVFARKVLRKRVRDYQKEVDKLERRADALKQDLWQMFNIFFVFLGVLFTGVAQASMLRCKHLWVPVILCTLGSTVVGVATLQRLSSMQLCKVMVKASEMVREFAYKRLSVAVENELPQDEDYFFEMYFREFQGTAKNLVATEFYRRKVYLIAFIFLIYCVMLAAFRQILCL